MKNVSTQCKAAWSSLVLTVLFVVASFTFAAAQKTPAMQALLANNQQKALKSTDSVATTASPAAASIVMDAKGKKIIACTVNGKTYKVGDTITLGAANPGGYGAFQYVRTAPGMKYGGDNGDGLSRKWENSQFVIKGMDNGMKYYKNHNAQHPMYFFFEIKGFFGGLYQIKVEDAVQAKEMLP